MATRQWQASAGVQPAPPGALGFQQLPDELLTCILGKLNTRNRHRAALVSRRWHECAHVPALCRRVEAELPARYIGLPAHAGLASLTAWLLRHKQHVRSMRLRVDFWVEEEEAEEQAQLACCLMACLGSRLEALHIDAAPLVVAAWAPAVFGSLRQLQLSRCGQLTVSSSLHSLTQLTRLVLAGSTTRFAEGARLPPSIEQLRFTDVLARELPEQLMDLPRLSVLTVTGNLVPGGGYSGLTRLSALTRLQLARNSHVPACVGQLTSLEALALEHSFGGDAQRAEQAGAALNAALATLTQLTSLLAGDISLTGGLPALAELPCFQRLCLLECDGLGGLPAGDWCSSLRELGADAECLQRSCGALAAAEQLQHVVVWAKWSCEQLFDPAVLRWAARHPPLRRLLVADSLTGSREAEEACLQEFTRPWATSLASAVQRLQQERPGLQLTWGDYSTRRPFEASFSQEI